MNRLLGQIAIGGENPTPLTVQQPQEVKQHKPAQKPKIILKNSFLAGSGSKKIDSTGTGSKYGSEGKRNGIVINEPRPKREI